MKIFEEIFRGVDIKSLHGSGKTEIDSIGFDSRKVVPGQLFVALRGTQVDGHDYIDSAVRNGASAVLCEELPAELDADVAYALVESSDRALGFAASNFYGNPSSKLRLVGITGTNGKTTTATLLYDLYRKMGYKAGLISTVVYRIDDQAIDSTHTTPDAIRLNEMLARMVDAGCSYCFMEVSSHSIVQQRTAGLRFAGGIFTNITHDHLDYHGTFAEYIKAKKSFFDSLPKEAFALVNNDDKNGCVMVQNTRAAVKTFSLRGLSDFKCRIVEALPDGMLLAIDGEELWVRFIGRFNAYNLLGVYAAAMLLGAEKHEVLRLISELEPVCGRFCLVRSSGGVTAVIDYAHTPDALSNVLSAINEMLPAESKLYTVVGCGGNRDKAKRPVMARIAAENSDLAILTSDNPRDENPEDILNDMKAGLDKNSRAIVISDRAQAIKTAVMMARRGDMILVAGKGHENYQEIGGVKHHFDDREQVLEYFNS